MKSRIPALAEWLLTRFGIPQRNESLMGDLAEESRSGRSALWLWRETAVAIATTVGRDIRNHKLLAMRAIGMGWALTWGWQRIVLFLQPAVGGRIETLWAWFILVIFTWTVGSAIVGWVVARMHRGQQAAMVLAYTASMVIWRLWHLSAHYQEMKSIHTQPDAFATNVAINCVALICTLVGGFLQKPRDRRGYQSVGR
jgi:hypothetical protein